MPISILFFGATAVTAGTRETEIELAEGTTASELLEGIKAKYPGLARQKLLFAINEEYVPSDSELASGDTMAIFTPVSGG